MNTENAVVELTPLQRKAEAKFMTEIKDALTKLEKAGAALAVHTDFATYQEADWKSQSVSSRGNEVLQAIFRLRGDQFYGPEIDKRLKAVRFTFNGAPGKAADSMRFVDGTFLFEMHKTHNNLQEVAYNLLLKRMDEG